MLSVNVPAAIHFKGRDYTRPDEIPEAIRRPLDRAILRMFDSITVSPKLKSRIVFNDQEFESADAMPPETRRMYDEALAAMVPLHTAICAAVATERTHYVRGTIALSSIFGALLVAAAYLWLHGYFG